MKTLQDAQDAIAQATGIIRELIMADKLEGELDNRFIAFLDFWDDVYELDKMLQSGSEDADSVKRVLIYDAMTAESDNQDEE